MKTKHLACCGFDCGNCPFFIYTETRDAELGKKLIEKFSTPQKTFTTDNEYVYMHFKFFDDSLTSNTYSFADIVNGVQSATDGMSESQRATALSALAVAFAVFK